MGRARITLWVLFELKIMDKKREQAFEIFISILDEIILLMQILMSFW